MKKTATIKPINSVCSMSVDDVRNFCIKFRFYTKGTCEQYSEMFNRVRCFKGNMKDLEYIARDIYAHSEIEKLQTYAGTDSDGEIICSLMDGLENHCVSRSYTTKEVS